MDLGIYFRVLHLNNDGVGLMECGELAVARDTFRRALDMLSQALSIQGAQPKQCHCVTLKWSNNPKQSDESGIETLSKATACLPLFQKTYVYQRALIFTLPATGNLEYHRDKALNYQQKSNFSTESLTIIYNLALSYHLIGLRDNKTEMLERALGYYEIASCIRSKDSSLDVIDLAILNNVGQTQHELCNYTAAKTCFELLTEQLHILDTFGMIHKLKPSDCNGFVLNIMIEQPTLAAAA